MIKRRNVFCGVVLCLVIIVLACGLPNDFLEQTGLSPIQPAAQNQAIPSNLNEAIPSNAQEAIPSNIQEAIPSNIQEAIPSNIQEAIPSNLKLQVDNTKCNKIGVVKDATLPDGSLLSPGQSAVKIWEIQNIGSCPWTTGYALKYHSGDTLGATTAPIYFSQQVNSGDTARISVNITAPSTSGTYRSNWILMDNSNNIFGIGDSEFEPFWVSIQVGSTGVEQSSGDSYEVIPKGTGKLTGLEFYLYDDYNDCVDSFFVNPDLTYTSILLNECETSFTVAWKVTRSEEGYLGIKNTYADHQNELPTIAENRYINPLVIERTWNVFSSYSNIVRYEISVDGTLQHRGTMTIDVACPP